MEEKKKNNNRGMKIVMVLLIILVIVLSGYIVYDKVIEKNDTNTKDTTKKNETDKVIKISENEKELLMSQVEEYVTELAPKFNDLDINNLDNNDVLLFAYHEYVKNNTLSSSVITKQNLQEFINKYFENKTVNFTDIICPTDNKVLFNYNSESCTYTYNENHPGHGGGSGYRSSNYYVDSSIKGTQYTLKVKIAYGSVCGDTCGPIDSYYSNANDSFNRQNALLTKDSNELGEYYILTDSEYKSIEDKLPTTTFKFEKTSNGNFSLTNVKID